MIRQVPFLLAVWAAPAIAQPEADLADIDRQVSAFVGAPTPPVDRRLHLAHCPAPLSLGWYGSGQRSVQVRCPVAGGWTLYVAVTAAGDAAEALAVRRGDAVTISVGGEGFAVSQPGEALEGGVTGSWIKVRGLAAKASVLRGRVLGPGVVGIELP